MSTCTHEDTMMELKVMGTDTEHFTIGPETASKLDISEGDILLAKNPVNHKSIAGEVTIDKSVEEKTVLVDKTIFESIGLDDGSEIMVSKYEKEIRKPVKVDFKVERRENSNSDFPSLVEEDEEEFIDFVKNRKWTKDSRFLWEDKNLMISLDGTDLQDGEENVFALTELEEFNCNYTDSKSYSGVLLVDLSGSMETRDLVMEEIDQVVEKISDGIESTKTTKFLEELSRESEIKRVQGVTLCVLNYLFEQVKNDRIHKTSIILFSDEASIIEFDGVDYFSVKASDIEDAFEEIIEEIRYHARGRTNISASLEEAVETMKDFEHEKIKQVLLLTDGEPRPSSVDDKDTVLDIVERRLSPREDVIINTIGLGDEVDHNLLDKIANKTGGEYTYVRSLEDLNEVYSEYSDPISIGYLDP